MGFTHNLDFTEYILTLVDLNTCNWALLLISLKQSIVEEVPVDSSLPKMLSEGIKDSFRKSTTRIISLQYRWGNVKYHASRFTRKLVPRSKQSTTYNAVNTYTCSTRKNARLRLATVNTWASFQWNIRFKCTVEEHCGYSDSCILVTMVILEYRQMLFICHPHIHAACQMPPHCSVTLKSKSVITIKLHRAVKTVTAQKIDY